MNDLFTKEEFRWGHNRNLYAYYYSRNLIRAIRLHVTLRCFVRFWEPGGFYALEEHGAFEKWRCTILQMCHEAKCIMSVPLPACTHIAVRSGLFKAFLCSELEAVHACYIAKIFKMFKEIIPIRLDVRFTKYESDEKLEAVEIR